MQAAAIEAEGIDEEILSGDDVLVSQNGNESLEIRYNRSPFSTPSIVPLRSRLTGSATLPYMMDRKPCRRNAQSVNR